MHINCKLTTKLRTTRRGYLWKPLEWNVIPAEERGGGLCSPSYFHFYRHPLLAAFFNSIHANLKDLLLWEVEVRGVVRHEFDKSGATELMLKSELPLPVITTTQRVAASILFVKEGCKDEIWNEWADRWLSGEDRSEDAAYRAAWEAAREADAAELAAREADAAVWAARAAARAARAVMVGAAEAAVLAVAFEAEWRGSPQERLIDIISEVMADPRFDVR